MSRYHSQISSHLSEEIAKHTGEELPKIYADVSEMVEECVSLNYSDVFELTIASPEKATSRKPSNISVNLEMALSMLGQAPALSSKDPAIIGGAVCTMCAVVARSAKIEMNPETGFVYWVAYSNREERWQIQRDKIAPLVSEACQNSDTPISISADEVERHLNALARYGCIEFETIEGREYVVLREVCKSK